MTDFKNVEEFKLRDADGDYFLVSVAEFEPDLGLGFEPALTVTICGVGDAKGPGVPNWAADAQEVDGVDEWIAKELRNGQLACHAYELEGRAMLSGNLSVTVSYRLLYVHSSECSGGNCEYLKVKE